MPAWPSSVPQDALLSSYGERPQRNVASFQPDTGIAIERRRSSVSTDDIAFEQILDNDEWEALLAFYRDDLKDGTLTFTRNHPRTGDAGVTFKFVEAPVLTGTISVQLYRVSIKLVRMP